MVTVTQLRAFLAVARNGSVHAAAEELYVSQPSVSAALAALARELGVPLVERDGRGMRLTEAGRTYEPYAQAVLGLLEQGGLAASEADRARKARIRVAAVNTAGEYLVPPLIRAYREVDPNAELLLEISNRDTVGARLVAHESDVGIGGRPANRDVEAQPFLDNEMIVVGREILDDLGRATWLLREPGSGTRGATERFLARNGIEPPERLTLGSNGALKQAMKLGLGVTLISRDAVRHELHEGELVEIPAPDTPLLRRWYVLLPRGLPTRPAVQEFCEFLHSPAARRAIEESL